MNGCLDIAGQDSTMRSVTHSGSQPVSQPVRQFRRSFIADAIPVNSMGY